MRIAVTRSREHGKRADEAAFHLADRLGRTGVDVALIVSHPNERVSGVRDVVAQYPEIGGLAIANCHPDGERLAIGEDTLEEVQAFAVLAPSAPIFIQLEAEREISNLADTRIVTVGQDMSIIQRELEGEI